jgi:hypothetical protein
MKSSSLRNAAMLALLAGSLMVAACSEAPKIESTKTEPVKMKMTTTVPPGIASPDKVETRLGTLNFFDGFPDDVTVEKLYENLDFQRAVQAYLLALAPVSQAANRKGILEVGPANTTVPIFEQMMNPRSIFLWHWHAQQLFPSGFAGAALHREGG